MKPQRTIGRQLGIGLLFGSALLVFPTAGSDTPKSGYEIAKFRCDSENTVGNSIRVTVEIKNEGPTDPGIPLTVFGTQNGSTDILLTPEGGLLIFAEPGERTTKTFLHASSSAGDIKWNVSIRRSVADCTTTVLEQPDGGKSDDEEGASDSDDDGGGGDKLAKNIIAAHDRTSRQYEKNCDDCHEDIHSRQSLEPSIATAHRAMFEFAPGEPGDNKQCVWCHRTVDLTQGTQMAAKSRGNLRRYVDVTLCAVCHGPSGPAKQYFQTGMSRTNPDGPLLYDLVCAACHGELAHSDVKGEFAEDIQEEIDENEGGMGALNVLSAEQIQAIADALAKPGGGGDD